MNKKRIFVLAYKAYYEGLFPAWLDNLGTHDTALFFNGLNEKMKLGAEEFSAWGHNIGKQAGIDDEVQQGFANMYMIEVLELFLKALENDPRVSWDEHALLHELLTSAFRQAKRVVEKKAAFYIAAPHGLQFHEFAKSILEVGLVWKQTLIWAKNNLVLGRSDYQGKHEVFFYGNFGDGRVWNGGRKQTTVMEEQLQRISFLSEKLLQINFGDQMYLVRGENLEAFEAESDLLQVDKPQKNELHPTIKPQRLIKKMIRNSTNEGDVIYDPFSGSGTSILASQNTNRICYAMELLPKFVAVGLQRWMDATGSKPVLVEA